MLDTFKARLKAKLLTLGVNNLTQKRLDEIAARLHKKYPDITEEKDHDEKIDEFNELQPLDELAKHDDKVRTLETQVKKGPPKKDPPSNDGGTDPKKDDPPANDDAPAWAKSLMQEVQSLRTEKVQGTIKSKVLEKLKDKVPDKFYGKRALPEKEDDIDGFISEIEKDWTDFKQEQVNAGLMSATPPSGGGSGGGSGGKGNDPALDADIKAWAEKNKPAAKKEAASIT